MNNLSKQNLYIASLTLALGLLMGWFFFGGTAESNINEHGPAEQNNNTTWTCSMHPQIRQPEPGQCPLCGMDLIPLDNSSSEDENPMEIKMSPMAMQLANVQTSVVTRQKPVKEVKINGKVKADERRVYSQSSHIPGRVENLLISFTGEKVSKGQIMAYVYSPELVTAQEELFEATKFRDSQPQLYQAAKGKLRNWKLTEQQIDNIIKEGSPQEQFPILADVSGVVMNKRVNLGDYIKTGQPVFEVADLSKVWVLFDVYESDMPWIKVGDEVSFSVQSLPGKSMTGEITFIDPTINPKTRVATARVELINRDGSLKPEMFATGLVNSPLENTEEVLIVPKSAVMWTGRRSVVYVINSSVSGIGFIMREVELGPGLGDSYIVNAGIKEGEEIATNGTFSIDAAAQLAGKPSMMNPEGGIVSTGHNHGGTPATASDNHSGHSKSVPITMKARESLNPLLEQYLLLKDALVSDNLEDSKLRAQNLKDELSKVNMSEFKGEAHDVWMQHSTDIESSIKLILGATDINGGRKDFKTLSDQFVMLAKAFGPFDRPLYVQHCPMADENNGAEWLSLEKEIRNPYFGEKMLKCGEVTEEIIK